MYYVSFKFRKAAENHASKYRVFTWKMKKGDQMEKLINYYSGFRLPYLQQVQLDVCFPDSEQEERICFERESDQREKDQALNVQIQWLFETLKGERQGNLGLKHDDI